MPTEEDPTAELLRRFNAAIAGAELADLRQLAASLGMLHPAHNTPGARPELRRRPRAELALYRVRVDLDTAKPPIWRRLDVRSDLPLSVVHRVLQAAFDWTDSHLHRFSLGGGPFDRTSQIFLCPYDVEEAEEDDEGGIPAADVRLDETLQDPGDVLHYVYDYGDSWELTVRLEEVLPATADAPSATAVDGRRAAPPEDCGGVTDAESLAEVLEDPAQFDLEECNEALRGPDFTLLEHGLDERLLHLAGRLHYTDVGEDLTARLLGLVTLPTEPTPDELDAALGAHRWFLERAAGTGIELTSAGYLKPSDVEAAARVVPAMGDWIGKNNREVHAAPLLEFRQSLQRMGLLRKRKGVLLLTRAGAAAARDPRLLWNVLAEKATSTPPGFETEATLLLLAYAGTAGAEPLPLTRIAAALSHLGWGHRDGREVQYYELYRLPAFDMLLNVSDRPRTFDDRDLVSPVAGALARAALRR